MKRVIITRNVFSHKYSTLGNHIRWVLACFFFLNIILLVLSITERFDFLDYLNISVSDYFTRSIQVCYVLCASVYMCFVVTCWERADLLALVCGVFCEFVTFPLVSWVGCGT